MSYTYKVTVSDPQGPARHDVAEFPSAMDDPSNAVEATIGVRWDVEKLPVDEGFDVILTDENGTMVSGRITDISYKNDTPDTINVDILNVKTDVRWIDPDRWLEKR